MTDAEEMQQHKAVELTVLDQMPDTNVLSPPGGTYCLPRIPVMPPTSTYAASYEHLRYLLRVSATDPPPRLRGLLKEAPEILCCGLLYHSRISSPAAILYPQHDNQVKQWSKRLAVARVCTFHIPRNNFLQKALCQR
jgi:hypothetical protein